MRPPILFLTVAFGVGLWAGLDPFVFAGAALWGVALSLIAAAACLAARTPLGAAVGIMGVAGLLWGTAAVRERAATCTGRWAAGENAGEGRTRAVIVRLADPAPAQGGIVDADVLPGACAGSVRLRWPEGTGARGGTTWVVAGKWTGSVLVVRRTRALDLVPHGRGALRDALAARSTELFGTRAPIVNALVFAPNAELDSDIRERYVRSGLAHLLSISGLHVGFMAAWLALILGKLHLAARARSGATAVLLLGYLWLLGFPAPAVRAGAMLVLADVARLRERVVAPRGVVALAALGVLVQDPWALQSVGAWLS
ncbi:MAG TPA: ComEC/Rec2 family competence protein, partial [Gemmatimonadales bacterium]|nr:ComEC/Rec2 family competence protein [Gemmatimonadales bacterium]